MPMAWAQFSGGSGSAESPYLISSETDWNTFASNVNGSTTYSSNYFKLTNDISVTTMVGVSGHTFNGTFDGNNHTITIAYGSADNYNRHTAPRRYIDGTGQQRCLQHWLRRQHKQPAPYTFPSKLRKMRVISDARHGFM